MSQKPYYGLNSVTKSPGVTFYRNEIVEFIGPHDRSCGCMRWRQGVVVTLRQIGTSYAIGLMEYQKDRPVTALNSVANNEADVLFEKDFPYIRKLEGEIYMRPVDNPYMI